jgi:hypothetical protein
MFKLAFEVLDAVRSSLRAYDADLSAGFPATYTAACTALDTALAGTPAALAAGAPTLAGSALADLERDLVGAATPLRARLLERIIGACPGDDADWREFDRLIDLFGATLVAEGRDGAAFARVTVRNLVVAADHSAACAALRDLVSRRSELHAVACVLNGASDPKDAPAFDCAVVTAPRRWPVNCKATQSADTRLAEFLRMYAAGPRQTTIVTLVGAFDPEGARDRGEAKIQALVDQYMTRHRVERLTLGTSSLVLRPSDQHTWRLHREPPSLAKAYTRTTGPLEPLIDAFRYAGLARSTEAPVVQVLHRWIALESLARGSDHPAEFLYDRVSSLVALHAVRQSLTATWDVVRTAARRSAGSAEWTANVEPWLRVNAVSGRLGDLTRWIALLGAKPTTRPATLTTTTTVRRVARLVDDQLVSFNPFAEQAFRRWRARLQNASRFVDWVEGIRKHSRVALVRMYAVRNASVHSAVGEVRGAEQLSIAARNIIDAALEVLPNWLEGRPARRPPEALDLVSQRYAALIAANGGAGGVAVDADRLTLEQGDGISPLTEVGSR